MAAGTRHEPHAIGCLGVNDPFDSIPRKVEEDAAVDGCDAWRTLVFIILLLALPGLEVSGLLV